MVRLSTVLEPHFFVGARLHAHRLCGSRKLWIHCTSVSMKYSKQGDWHFNALQMRGGSLIRLDTWESEIGKELIYTTCITSLEGSHIRKSSYTYKNDLHLKTMAIPPKHTFVFQPKTTSNFDLGVDLESILLTLLVSRVLIFIRENQANWWRRENNENWIFLFSSLHICNWFSWDRAGGDA